MNMNSGYVGWSMSVRAADAYGRGLRPLSKIGSGKYVKAAALIVPPAEWHHTGRLANRTDFYDAERIRRVARSLRRQRRDAAAIRSIRAERARARSLAPTWCRRYQEVIAYANSYLQAASESWLRAERATDPQTREYWLWLASHDLAIARDARAALRAKIAAWGRQP